MKSFKDLRVSLQESNDKELNIKGHKVLLKSKGNNVEAYVDGKKLDTFKDEKEAIKDIKAFLDSI